MLGDVLGRIVDRGSLWERFKDLGRGRRRLLCVALHFFGLAAVLSIVSVGYPWWPLLGVGLCGLSAISYLPLSVYLQGLDHHRVGEKMLLRGGRLDEHESVLLRETLDRVRWIQGAVLVAGLYYLTIAGRLGWWLPQENFTLEQWSLTIIVIFWLSVYSLPTVVAAWIDRDDHGLEYPCFDDLD